MFKRKKKEIAENNNVWNAPAQELPYLDDGEKIINSLAVFTGIEEPEYNSKEVAIKKNTSILFPAILPISLITIDNACISINDGNIKLCSEKIKNIRIFIKEINLNKSHKMLFESAYENRMIKIFGHIDKENKDICLNIIYFENKELPKLCMKVELNFLFSIKDIDNIYTISSLIDIFNHYVSDDEFLGEDILKSIGLMDNMVLEI